VAIQPIRLFGDPVLRTPAAPVTDFDKELRRLVEDLTDTMLEAPGAGLAAPQIGVGLAVFSYFADGQLGYLINPEITEQRGEQDGLEGCLSIPGVTAFRTRAAVAVAWGVDLDQQPVQITGTGELARALQHETDHLRGELYIDALTGPERRSVLRQIREQQAGPGWNRRG
jgi:peptide deformylase